MDRLPKSVRALFAIANAYVNGEDGLRQRVIKIPSSTRLEIDDTQAPVRHWAGPGSRYGPSGHCR
jgi:hypothetical protein